MAKRGREQRIYKYNCTITNEEFKTTSKVKDTSELVSIRAYYEMNPEEDDRPEAVIKNLGDLPDHSEEALKEESDLPANKNLQ